MSVEKKKKTKKKPKTKKTNKKRKFKCTPGWNWNAAALLVWIGKKEIASYRIL